MAVVATVTGRVDVPAQLSGQPGQPAKLGLYHVHLVWQAADYSTGLPLASVLTAIGATTIIGCEVACMYLGSAALYFPYTTFDRVNNKLRIGSAFTGAALTDYGATNNDNADLLVTAY